MFVAPYRALSRDDIVDLREQRLCTLNEKVCDTISVLGLRHRGCRAGARRRQRLQAALNVTSSVNTAHREGGIPVIIGNRSVTSSASYRPTREELPARQQRKQQQNSASSRSTVLTDLLKTKTGGISHQTGSDLRDVLSCYVVNARSLKKVNAVQLLQTGMISCECDVAAVTKTWLSKAVNSNCIAIDGYTLYRRDRARRRGGGIAMYVKDRCQSKALLASNSVKGATAGHELMWLEIIKKGETYIVGLVYHPPKPIYDSKEFVTALSNDIEELSCQYQHACCYT